MLSPMSIQDYLLQNDFIYSEEDRAFVREDAYIPVGELSGKDITYFQEKFTSLQKTIDREKKEAYLLRKFEGSESVRMYRQYKLFIQNGEDFNLTVHLDSPTSNERTTNLIHCKTVLVVIYGVFLHMENDLFYLQLEGTQEALDYVDKKVVQSLLYYIND